jgi:hypothetical protein
MATRARQNAAARTMGEDAIAEDKENKPSRAQKGKAKKNDEGGPSRPPLQELGAAEPPPSNDIPHHTPAREEVPADRLPISTPTPSKVRPRDPEVVALLESAHEVKRSKTTAQVPIKKEKEDVNDEVMEDIVYCNPIAAVTTSTKTTYDHLRGKMSRPATLTLDLDDDSDTLQDKATLFRIGCQSYFDFYAVPEDRRAAMAFNWIGGRLQRIYGQKFNAKGTHLSWTEFLALLNELTDNTNKTQFDLKCQLDKFTFENVCAKADGSSRGLIYGVGRLEEVLARMQGLDELSRCYYLYRSLPQCIKEKVRNDNATQEEFNDYSRLKKATLQHQDLFDSYLEEKKTRRRQKDIPYVNAMQAVPDTTTSPTSHPPAASSKPRIVPPPAAAPRVYSSSYARFVNPNNVPQAERFANWLPNRVPVAVRSLAESEKLWSEGKCLLCESTTHTLRNCPQRDAAYKKGEFFYCPKHRQERR